MTLKDSQKNVFSTVHQQTYLRPLKIKLYRKQHRTPHSRIIMFIIFGTIDQF